MISRCSIVYLAAAFLVCCERPTDQNKAQVSSDMRFEELEQSVRESFQRGQYAEALTTANKALAIAEARDPNAPDVALALSHIGIILRQNGKDNEAEPLFVRALAIWQSKPENHGSDHAIGEINLASIYAGRGDYSRAIGMYERALPLLEKSLGANHEAVAGALNHLAVARRHLGKTEQAASAYRRALAIQERLSPPNFQELARTLSNFSELLRLQGQIEEARPLQERALELRQGLDANHPDVAISLNNLGLIHFGLRSYGQAATYLERSLAITERNFEPSHPRIAVTLRSLGAAYRELGRVKDAADVEARAARVEATKR